jgi:hypothetical protein
MTTQRINANRMVEQISQDTLQMRIMTANATGTCTLMPGSFIEFIPI